MAHAGQAPNGVAPSSADRKRVKVYELKNNDWYDRGTGFCTGQLIASPNSSQDTPDARVIVVSEDEPNRTLLETRISKDDGYQKQQDTLIVWTESNGVDMALSFQEAEGCSSIWEFVSDIQGRLISLAPDDGLSDDLMEPVNPVVLPEPQLGHLDEVEGAIRAASTTTGSRDALAKFVMHPDHMYILKLAPLVAKAEQMESTPDLHRLCTIMKHLILLNDTSIIEFVVTDQAIMGVVGALEYDPDFPSHRANHRHWLSDASKFKEVVPIRDPAVRQKIHWTYRLLYLKDVVLARILDDPTFSVLNSLIFFHQVDIVNHLQNDPRFLNDLFDIFQMQILWPSQAEKKKEAVLFIQNCCAVSKNIQAASRQHLYQNFIQHGLFTVVVFALRHHDAAVRVAGMDILVALIDHDPHIVRTQIFATVKDKGVPLSDDLIELLLLEVDLGVKSQMADAIKIILDPSNSPAPVLDGGQRSEAGNAVDAVQHQNRQRRNGELRRAPETYSPQQQQQLHQHHQTTDFIDNFYKTSIQRLFAPLHNLESRPTMSNLNVQDLMLHTHLVDILCFFTRQHGQKARSYIIDEHLHARIAQLLRCPQKYIKLIAIKWFRTVIGLGDELHYRYLCDHGIIESVLEIVEETMPRDNLLNSACLEFFEYVKREGVRPIIDRLGTHCRERLMRISYVNTFQALVIKFEQLNSPYALANGNEDSFTTQEGTPQRMVNGRQSFAGLREMDDDEARYFNADDEADDDEPLPTAVKRPLVNGASPVGLRLVNYADDDDDEDMDIAVSTPDHPHKARKISTSDDQRTISDPSDEAAAEPMDDDTSPSIGGADDGSHRGRNRTPVAVEGSPGRHSQSPLEPLPMKRRREEDDEDELGKMMGGPKRRNSSTSLLGRAVQQAQLDGATPGTSAGATGDNEQYAAENGGPVGDIQQQQPQQPSHGHGNAQALRRKNSLRSKNESAGTSGKFSIKPISLRATKAGHEEQPQPQDVPESAAVEAVQEGKEDSGGGDAG